LQRVATRKRRRSVLALLAERKRAAIRRAAFEKAWAWYGGPEPTDAVRAELDAELEEGWALARAHRRS
jgi:hypothetical protein